MVPQSTILPEVAVTVAPAFAWRSSILVTAEAGAVPNVIVQLSVVPPVRVKLPVAVAVLVVAGTTLPPTSAASHSVTGAVISSEHAIPTTEAASRACNKDVRIAIPPVFPN